MANTAIAKTAKTPAVAITDEQMDHIEGILSTCTLDVLGSQGTLARTMQLAAGVAALREAITPEMMSQVMALMNTSVGFRTDRDPSQYDKGGKPFTPYSVAVVKECFIDSLIRGAFSVGNEWNIIASRTYFTKEFFQRKVREFPELTDLKLCPGVPTLIGDKGALVPYVATWRVEGVESSLERVNRKLPDGTFRDERIPVRVNAGMGVDAILGKATRKMLASIYARLTGSDQTPDGEIGDVIETDAVKLPDDTGEAGGGQVSGSDFENPTNACAIPDGLAMALRACLSQQDVDSVESTYFAPGCDLDGVERMAAKAAFDKRREEIAETPPTPPADTKRGKKPGQLIETPEENQA